MKSTYLISAIIGDGIGPEVLESALLILHDACKVTGLNISVKRVEAGDGALRKLGRALPKASEEVIKSSDACLKAPVGETAADVIIRLRQEMDLYANLRPIKALLGKSSRNIDFAIVRENTEDLYKGMETTFDDSAIGIRLISRKSSSRIAKFAFNTSKLNTGKEKHSVVAVHKANVLKKTCGLFLEECRKVSREFPGIKYSEMLVDTAAQQIIRNPSQFDVLLTTNVFGDILSDEAAEVAGSLGLAPSGNLGDNFAIFEPVHGAAPDIAGRRIANPIATILSAKMMLDYLGEKYGDKKCKQAAGLIQNGVTTLLRSAEHDVLTPDLGGRGFTQSMTEEIRKLIVPQQQQQQQQEQIAYF
jgi:3-isopropylmalate dehydrogenase